MNVWILSVRELTRLLRGRLTWLAAALTVLSPLADVYKRQGGLTFGLIAWATPITYVSVVGDRLQVQVSELTDRLALTKLADAGPILDVFVRESLSLIHISLLRAGGGKITAQRVERE